MENKTIHELIAGYCSGSLSASEAKRLRHLIDNDQKNLKIFQEIRESQKILNTIQAHEQIDTREAWEELSYLLSSKPRKNHKILWIVGTAIAASVTLLFILIQTHTPSSHIPEQPIAQVNIHPGSVKAILSYNNGEEIHLTSSSSSHITAPDGSIIVNDSLKGLQYNKQTTRHSHQFQTLRVPAGGEYRFTLADGTHVWVNSSSELRFPSQFPDGKREIYMKGEIYLEVAKDESRPFIVHSGNNQVRVLGTKFNMTAYPEEQKIITTLVSGSIEFTHDNSKVLLKPGEQSVMDYTTNQLTKQEVDVSIYTSWINGTFEYEKMPLSYITRQLSRWYDVQFIYEATEFQEHPFTGIVKRNQTLEEVLSIIEKTTNVKFEISERKVIVKKTEDAGNIFRFK